MEKVRKIRVILCILLGTFVSFSFVCKKYSKQVLADETTNYPRNGESGNLLYVNGSSTYFNSGQADLAIYCYNNSGSAWSDKVSYRCFGDMLRVMIPYKDGQRQTWSHYIVCRYDPSKDPSTDGFGGVFNQTDDIPFSSMLYAQNVVNITGYDNGKMNYAFSNSNYFGIKAENHIYLDLSSFTDWEADNAKFAIYFAYPSNTNESRWSQANSSGGYYSSFLWKVNGQTNDHLYEGIVPKVSSNTLWNMVIAARFNKDASEPNWDAKYNQTQNLSFNSSNHNANMIRINGWDSGELDATNSISKATRLEFFGRYFLDTVTCSGSGASDSTTSAMWNAVKNEYVNHISTPFQGDIWLAEGGGESLLSQAITRYDYIIFFKQYDHEDFINRQTSANVTQYSSQYVYRSEKKKDYTVLIVIISVVSLSILGSVIVLKRKHIIKK